MNDSRAPRHHGDRVWGIVAALALVAGLTAGLPAKAVALDEPVSVPVAVGPRVTTVHAASGTAILAGATGDTMLSTNSGKTWVRSAFQTSDPADYVASGKAVWVAGASATVLDLKTNRVSAHKLGETARAVNATKAVIGNNGSGYYLVNLNGSGSPVYLALDANLPKPKGVAKTEKSFLLGAKALAEVTRYYKSSASSTPDYVDVDRVNLSGTPYKLPFRITGKVLHLGFRGTTLEYALRESKAVQWCTRTVNSSKPKCKEIATVKKSDQVSVAKLGKLVGLTVNGKLHLYEGGKLREVRVSGTAPAFITVGDATRPLVRTWRGNTGSTYQVAKAAKKAKTQKAKRLFADFHGPAAPSNLDLNQLRMVGSDTRYNLTGWQRPITATSIGAETRVAKVKQPKVSAGRMAYVQDGKLVRLDGGVVRSRVSGVTALKELSGPYALATVGGKSRVVLPSGKSYGSNAAAVFGSRVLELNADRTGGKVVDTANGNRLVATLPGLGGYQVASAHMWGDKVVLGLERGAFSITRIFNVATEGLGSTCSDSYPVAVGDEFAVVLDVGSNQFKVWNFAVPCTNSAVPVLKAARTSISPAVDGTLVAYSTGAQLRLQEVSELEGVGQGSPRVLSLSTTQVYNVNGIYWTLGLDATAPLTGGSITITGNGRTRTIPVKPSPDGSVRGFDSEYQGWDGLDDNGVMVPDGNYRWTFNADSTLNGQPLRAIDGRSLVTGTVRVTSEPLPKITVTTPKVSDTTPAVGQQLSVSTSGWGPSGLTYKYQWYVGSKAIPGATGSSYVVAASNYKQKLKVKVTASCPGRPSGLPKACTGYQRNSKTSAETKKVATGKFKAVTPKVSDTTPAVGQRLTVATGKWAKTPIEVRYSYKWYLVNAKGKAKAVSGKRGEAATYVVKAADKGSRLKVKVTAKSSHIKTASKTSATTKKVK
jgi:hypothetical protein